MKRTAKEIRRYVREQEWYCYWKTFILCTDLPLVKKMMGLLGYDPEILFFFFDWSKTLQGFAYWAQVNDEFNKWYNDGQE